MEVPYDQLIDIGLNVLGYVVAATLGMLIYSAFRRRQPAASTQPTPMPQQMPQATAAPAGAVEGTRRLNYVDLRRSDADEPNGDLAGAVSRTAGTGTRRDRAEIIRLAREMIRARTPQETIKRTLPITDGELALLQSGERRQPRGANGSGSVTDD